MATFKTMPWSIGEVRTFLCLIADERIQRELEGATRNQKVYQEVSELLVAHGYQRTFKQCREKLKKLKSDYKSIRYRNGRRSSWRRKSWKWFEKMEAIYGHRPASKGKVDLESLNQNQDQLYWQNVLISKEDPDDTPLVPAAMTTSDSNTTPQKERNLQLAFNDAVRAREMEAALRREQNAETAAFHQACLGTLRQLMQVLSGPRDMVPPEPVSTQATSSTTPQHVFTGRREQPLGEERLAVLSEMLEEDEEQQERSLQLAFHDAVRAREMEAALRREQNAETAAFHQACLGTLRQLVQVLSDRRDRFLHPWTRPSSSTPGLDQVPPPLD
ncbi:uncharacterized protein [Osmerus mordax]|uniref:uncharacterized protein isoform X2 n=1 Tax=Osmerus mordax TaxID=8014 RepID=UPI003510A8A1